MSSVFGRIGDVIAQIGDYNTNLVTEVNNLYYTEMRVSANVDVAANTSARHTHSNLTTLNSITAAGSGSIITTDERNKLAGIDDGAEVNAVDSVFGRTGAVVATNGDYTWAQIDKTTSSIADITTRSHTDLTNIGTNTHTQIDNHISSTSNPHSVTAAQVGALTDAPVNTSTYGRSNGAWVVIPAAPVSSVFNRTGAVVAANGDYDTDMVTEGSSNLYYTEARVEANQDVSANTNARHTHSNLSTLDDITNAGSGLIITSTERTRLEGYSVRNVRSGATTLGVTDTEMLSFVGSNGLSVTLTSLVGTGLTITYSLSSTTFVTLLGLTLNSILRVNQIFENTTGSGVTIDGLLIRDAGIPEAAVTAHQAALSIAASQVTNLEQTIQIAFDGEGTVLDVGAQGDVVASFDMTITGWTLLADQTGSIEVDVWADTYANYPPTVADSIVGVNKPTISSDDSAQATGLSWSLTKGDTVRFNIDSVTDITRVTLILSGERS